MKNLWINRIDRALAWCYYALFFLVPLAMWPTTFELFEYNKLWTVFGISSVVLFLWVAKASIARSFTFRRTPLDIPLGLFLLSQILSFVFSMDHHTSWWGYYSRFNGGLLSILSYIFLYYAFVNNLAAGAEVARERLVSFKILLTSFIAGLAVALWGLPSHFGYDPTCLMFRGELNVGCWTEAFQPKIRMFSTLGQPNWLAAYLSIIIPISLAFGIDKVKKLKTENLKRINKSTIFILLFLVSSILFYLDLTWTQSQSGFLGFWASFLFFVGLLKLYLYKVAKTKVKKLVKIPALQVLTVATIAFIVTSVIFGTPIARLNIKNSFINQKATETPETQTANPEPPPVELGGTDSGKIRLIVWRGAIDIFRDHPLVGSGVDTYAYAYYQYRPAAHNLTSEWDYLYNKAHNEYLNYLATTGALGLGSYLLFIGWFLYIAVRKIVLPKRGQKMEFEDVIFPAALLGGFVSILVSNFFGFSVVIVNLYLFFIPALFFELTRMLPEKNLLQIGSGETKSRSALPPETVTILLIASLILLYIELMLFRFWIADKNYALGNNLNKIGEYIQASQPLADAVRARPGEPIFKDELAVNYATLALILSEQNEATQAAQFEKQAKDLSNEVIEKNPNNVSFFKSRTRVMYALSQIDPKYLDEAIKSISRARELAPTDAKILYNHALLLDQKGERDEAIKLLNEAIKLKSNYRDGYYALGLFYGQMAEDLKTTDLARSEEYKKLARENLETIINKLGGKDDTQAKDLLKSLD